MAQWTQHDKCALVPSEPRNNQEGNKISEDAGHPLLQGITL